MHEPSPPYGHVSWRDARNEVEHDAAAEVTVLAETVMGRDARGGALVRLSRLPREDRALPAVGDLRARARRGRAAPDTGVPVGRDSRHHYVVHTGAEYHIEQNAVLNGLTVALAGAFVGAALGALWGSLVVRHAAASDASAVTSRGFRRRRFGGDR